MSRKIAHYGESDYSNVAVATLCKSFTVVDIFFKYFENLEIIS